MWCLYCGNELGVTKHICPARPNEEKIAAVGE